MIAALHAARWPCRSRPGGVTRLQVQTLTLRPAASTASRNIRAAPCVHRAGADAAVPCRRGAFLDTAARSHIWPRPGSATARRRARRVLRAASTPPPRALQLPLGNALQTDASDMLRSSPLLPCTSLIRTREWRTQRADSNCRATGSAAQAQRAAPDARARPPGPSWLLRRLPQSSPRPSAHLFSLKSRERAVLLDDVKLEAPATLTGDGAMSRSLTRL